MIYEQRRRQTNKEAKMVHSRRAPLILPFFFLIILITCMTELDAILVAGRSLKSLKEIPVGGNATFDCSPSGPCVPCSRAEKSNVKYRCGETGYRIRLKCLPYVSEAKGAGNTMTKEKRSALERKDLLEVNQYDIDQTISSRGLRRLQDDSSNSGGSTKGYTTYRSCIPAVDEERISVLTFEALMLIMLLSSGSFIYIRRNRAATHMRIPANPRF